TDSAFPPFDDPQAQVLPQSAAPIPRAAESSRGGPRCGDAAKRGVSVTDWRRVCSPSPKGLRSSGRDRSGPLEPETKV
ncbi:MAG TPA: hypothetical protein VKP65_15135, partial [Rhodothermales bacterium]|nr:hypothetical protein [Rhodothermales bacterium]